MRKLIIAFAIWWAVFSPGQLLGSQVPMEVRRLLGNDLSKEDRRLLKEEIEGRTFYTRHAVPEGLNGENMVIVTPDRVTIPARKLGQEGNDWSLWVNFPVEIEDVEFGGDAVEISLDGVGPADGISADVDFENISTAEDFWKAFNQMFSEVPLQDAHDDWPAEVREAIERCRLVNGMTKRQAYCVTGWPIRFEAREEEGVSVETWWLRTEEGGKILYTREDWDFTRQDWEITGLPESIRFENGVLVNAAYVGSGVNVNLD